MVLITPPLLQLLVFAFAATLEVKNNTLTIYNEDNGPHAQELVSHLTRAGAFSELRYVFDRKAQAAPAESELVVRHWFNSNLKYLWFNIPALLMILTTLITMIVTAMSVARERELGTFDQLLVSRYSPTEILIGKAIPAYLVAMAWPSTWPLLIIGAYNLLAANWLFRHKIG